jgi:TPR repeat protein
MSRAVKLFEKACGDGEADGCHNLARCYAEGNGVPRDSRRGLELYEQACEGGSAQACRFIIRTYEKDDNRGFLTPDQTAWLKKRAAELRKRATALGIQVD